MNTKPTAEALIDPLQEQGYATIQRAKLRQMLNYLSDTSIDWGREGRKIETMKAQLEEWLR